LGRALAEMHGPPRATAQNPAIPALSERFQAVARFHLGAYWGIMGHIGPISRGPCVARGPGLACTTAFVEFTPTVRESAPVMALHRSDETTKAASAYSLLVTPSPIHRRPCASPVWVRSENLSIDHLKSAAPPSLNSTAHSPSHLLIATPAVPAGPQPT
jgi:hypothetical protein